MKFGFDEQLPQVLNETSSSNKHGSRTQAKNACFSEKLSRRLSLYRELKNRKYANDLMANLTKVGLVEDKAPQSTLPYSAKNE